MRCFKNAMCFTTSTVNGKALLQLLHRFGVTYTQGRKKTGRKFLEVKVCFRFFIQRTFGDCSQGESLIEILIGYEESLHASITIPPLPFLQGFIEGFFGAAHLDTGSKDLSD